jgi:hypothetical protein
MRYLLVDDTDGRVLAELASAEQAVRLLGRFTRTPPSRSTVSLVQIDDHEGSLTGISSTVSMRPLPPFMEKPEGR